MDSIQKAAKATREVLINQGNLEPHIYLTQKNAKKIPYKEFLDILCCPLCKGDLELSETHLTCNHCKREYEIIDGIPNMMAEQSKSIGGD